jgi:hypothetical protein
MPNGTTLDWRKLRTGQLKRLVGWRRRDAGERSVLTTKAVEVLWSEAKKDGALKRRARRGPLKRLVGLREGSFLAGRVPKRHRPSTCEL